jgi:4-amino-4-deoxy-L-arabinose transferase-like glycosyltransferase
VRELVRQHFRFFLLATLAALGLRLLFILRFPGVTTDSFVYGDIAKNWLQHGIYGLSGINEISPTYIRLPGYPAFLAAVFAIAGVEHYRTALVLQMLVDIGTCFLIADLTRRLVSPRAARAAFLLSALCPFLANYAANALTETWEVFFTVLALDLAVAGLDADSGFRPWVGCGLAVGAAMLLRPDGALLVISISAYLMLRFLRHRTGAPALHTVNACLILVAVSLAALFPWTLRNLHTLHEFMPLAPRYANEEDAFVPAGFNRWMKTWIVDYSSVEEIYWAVPGISVDAEKLPARAFDSPEQREQTTQLLDDYNNTQHVTPALDARFAALASDRVRESPLRYYLGLPFMRVADMWLRPRTETLPSDSRWWEFDDDPEWLALAVSLGIINLAYLGAALAGLLCKGFAPKSSWCGLGLLLTFVIVRSAFLGTLENPEPRYTLECYPVVILLAAALFSKRSVRRLSPVTDSRSSTRK